MRVFLFLSSSSPTNAQIPKTNQTPNAHANTVLDGKPRFKPAGTSYTAAGGAEYVADYGEDGYYDETKAE